MNSLEKDKTSEYILVVDDQPINIRLLASILEKQGYNVKKATSGKLALNVAQTEPPQIILLDVMMPEMDGYEVCQRLKSDPQTAEIPVIFVSALSDTEDKVKAFEVGGLGFINKPFSSREIIIRVKTQLNQKNLLKITQEQNQQLQHQNQQLEEKLAATMAELKGKNEQLLKLQKELNQALGK